MNIFFATKAHMFADNPLKRLTFWMIQNSIDTVNPHNIPHVAQLTMIVLLTET